MYQGLEVLHPMLGLPQLDRFHSHLWWLEQLQQPHLLVLHQHQQSKIITETFKHRSDSNIYKDVSKSSRTVLVKRSFLTLDVKFLHHLQSTPLLYEYSSPSISAMLGSIPGSPFLELCQISAAIPLESLQWCRIFNPSSEASAWGRGKSHRGSDRVSMGDGGPLSCCSWPKTVKL